VKSVVKSPELLRSGRFNAFMATVVTSTAARYLPENPSALPLAAVRRRALRCEACPLYKLGTQTVFGEGATSSRVVFVGEQPGDQEDKAGKPFVGPAGRLLDEALVTAGIDRATVYVTNAVKHFKWKPAGKRRLHQKPSAREIAACKPWLEAELRILHPAVVVALGATAAQALMGPAFRVTRDRGKAFEDFPWANVFFATVHPSSILRGPPEDREANLALLVADLKKVAAHKAFKDSSSNH
jgi:DNA polymerase